MANTNHIPITRHSADNTESAPLPYRIDFTDEMLSTDTIASLTSIAVDPTGTMTADNHAKDTSGYTDEHGTSVGANKAVKFDLQLGTAGVTYIVTSTIVTTNGDTAVSRRKVIVE